MYRAAEESINNFDSDGVYYVIRVMRWRGCKGDIIKILSINMHYTKPIYAEKSKSN